LLISANSFRNLFTKTSFLNSEQLQGTVCSAISLKAESEPRFCYCLFGHGFSQLLCF
jgi:hypothetical protein